MTQQSIQLYDSLELLYYFDPRYYDSGSNKLIDHSGHERHGEVVSGTVTFGDDYGRESFGGASFDSGHIQDTGEIGIEQGTAYTAVMMCKPDGYIKNQSRFSIAGNRIGFVYGNNRTGNSQYGFDNSGAIPTYKEDRPYSVGEWTFSAIRVVPDIPLLQARTYEYTNDESDAGHLVKELYRDDWDGEYSSTGTGHTRVGGASTFGSYEHRADVTFFGLWSRNVSPNEMKHLRGMSAPRKERL